MTSSVSKSGLEGLDILSADVIVTVAASSRLLGSEATWQEGAFHLPLQSVASQSYRLDASTNLIAWTILTTNATPASTIWEFVDQDSAHLPIRFYRALFLPSP